MTDRNQTMKRVYELCYGLNAAEDQPCTEAGIAAAILHWVPPGGPRMLHGVAFRDEGPLCIGIKVKIDPLWVDLLGWSEEEIGRRLAAHLRPILPAALTICIHVEVEQVETLCTIKLGLDTRD